MTPGPSRVPPRVLAAGARPMLHHRSPEFSGILASVLDRLRSFFGTKGDVLPIHATGRGAMEAALSNLFSPGDEILCCCNGKFGEMWARLAEKQGLLVHRVATEWDRDIRLGEVEAALEANPRTLGLSLVHCDTTSGVANDVAALSRVANERGLLTLVDAVSALGGMEFRFDDWKVDVAVTASQKCLMSSPGLAFAAVSERAWERAGSNGCRSSYWDFSTIQAFLSRQAPQTPGTTPVHIVLQLDAALGLIEEEGIENVYARHERMAAMVRERLPSLGLELQSPNLRRFAPTVTAIACPDGVTPADVKAGMRERGILLARGLGPFEETSFRIGHLGDIRVADVARTLDALGEVF